VYLGTKEGGTLLGAFLSEKDTVLPDIRGGGKRERRKEGGRTA